MGALYTPEEGEREIEALRASISWLSAANAEGDIEEATKRLIAGGETKGSLVLNLYRP